MQARTIEFAAVISSVADRRVQVLSTMGLTPTRKLSVGLFRSWRKEHPDNSRRCHADHALQWKSWPNWYLNAWW